MSISIISIISMEGIIKRPDSNGNDVYTFENIIEYLKQPFNKDKTISWPITLDIPLTDKGKLLSMNLLFMTILGGSVGYLGQRIFL